MFYFTLNVSGFRPCISEFDYRVCYFNLHIPFDFLCIFQPSVSSWISTMTWISSNDLIWIYPDHLPFCECLLCQEWSWGFCVGKPEDINCRQGNWLPSRTQHSKGSGVFWKLSSNCWYKKKKKKLTKTLYVKYLCQIFNLWRKC